MVHTKRAVIVSTISALISATAVIIPFVIYGIYGIAIPPPSPSTLKIFAWVTIGGCLFTFAVLRFKVDVEDEDTTENQLCSAVSALGGIFYLVVV